MVSGMFMSQQRIGTLRLFCSKSSRNGNRGKIHARFNIGELLENPDVAPSAGRLTVPPVNNEQQQLDKTLWYKPFRKWVDERRAEAKRSLFVQVKSAESSDDLLDYCTVNLGPVKGMHFHRNPRSSTFSDFFVVEFEDVSSVAAALYDHAQHFSGGTVSTPVTSPFLWFSGKSSSSTQASLKGPSSGKTSNVFLPPFDQEELKVAGNLEKRVAAQSSSSSIEDQMVGMHRLLKMTDDSTRVRFLACEQVEACLKGLFPHAEVLPFGSSVNSFGKFDCDLDMVVHLGVQPLESPTSRLLFHAKGNAHGGQRMHYQRYCDQISSIVQHFLPGCQDVQNIFHARVPIVKYHQQLVGLECDLSLSMSGFYMSELLYLYGELDSRVRPLVFTVRRWAREQGLTQDDRPTPYFTNFTLTMMTIFFLQTRYQMLPPFSRLQSLARQEDAYVCEDGVDCTFLRDVSGLQPSLNACWDSQPHMSSKVKVGNNEGSGQLTLAQMLLDFFDFYARFDFERDAICIVSGRVQPKRAVSTSLKVAQKNVSFFLDVTNPLEPDLNVSANVQVHAVSKFRRKCEESMKKMWQLDHQDRHSCDDDEDSEHPDTTCKLFTVIQGEGLPRLNVKLTDLAILPQSSSKSGPEPAEQPVSSSSTGERRRLEAMKKKHLRVPKVREFFKPNF